VLLVRVKPLLAELTFAVTPVAPEASLKALAASARPSAVATALTVKATVLAAALSD